MNICILKESLAIGGSERSAANISKVLHNDHNVFLTLYDASNIKYSYSGRLIDLNLPPKPSLFGKVVNTFFRDVKLRKELKRNHIDILYSFTGIENRQTRYKYNVIKIISARDFGAMLTGYSKYRVALNNSDAMICNSEYIRNYYLSKYPKDTEKVYTVYNYIDIDEINRQAEESVELAYLNFLRKYTHTIVAVGRFCKEKGFEYLIKSFAQARTKNHNLGLVLIGNGDYRQKYLEIIEHFALQEHVFFTGFQENPYKYMALCSCFVLSSLSEGFPNVLAEAMALGLPVIAVNCYSGPAEILRKDKYYQEITDQYQECDFGIITPQITEKNNDIAIQKLGEAINMLLLDKHKMNYYAKMARFRAKDFSKQSTTEQMNWIFDKLVKREHGND